MRFDQNTARQIRPSAYPRPGARGAGLTRKQIVSRVRENPEPAPDWSAAIMAIAQARDRSRFEELFFHFAPRLKAFFIRLGTTPGAAEDLAQEAMLIVWRKAEHFDPARASAATWIFTIARNLRIDLFRREKGEGLPADMFNQIPEPDPSERAITAERETRVRAALAQLTPEQVDVIRLSFFEDRPHSEIAEALQLPLGTVKSRIRLAISRLRGLVGDV